jgi:hypothetical protein
MSVERKKCAPFSPSNRMPSASPSASLTAASAFDSAPSTRARASGIAGEIGREVARRREAGAVEQHAAEVFSQALAQQRVRVGISRNFPKGGHAFCQREVLTRDRLATLPGVKGKAAVIREEDLAVVLQVAPDLRRLRQGAEVVLDRFDLQHTTLGIELEGGDLVGMLPQFLRREKTAIRQAGAAVRGMDDRSDLRVQDVADFIN